MTSLTLFTLINRGMYVFCLTVCITHVSNCIVLSASSQRSRSLLSQKEEAVRESLLAADSLRPVTENTTDLSEENSLPDDTGSVTNSTQPKLAGSTDKDLTLHSQEEESTAEESVLQESPAELSAESREEPDSVQAAVAEDVNEEEQLEMDAPAVPGKKNGTGKGKAAAKRRSGRAANRR